MRLRHDDDLDAAAPARGRTPLFIGLGAALLLVLVAGYWLTRPPAPAPATAVAPAPDARPAAPTPAPVEAPAPAASAETPATPRPRPRREVAPAASATPAPVAPPGPVLVVESDVPGASVFLDRKFLGTTPLRTTDVTPGVHQINASAEGQDGLVRSVEIGETGETHVALEFRRVDLDASVAVVHKHGMGSCEGRLSASPSGLRYATTDKGDAFTLAFAEVERFEVDYLKKNLVVKKRGGKTWNFTDRNDNADRLFVFHRDVSKAREKLAAAR
jgi:hypothetical protein